MNARGSLFYRFELPSAIKRCPIHDKYTDKNF